MKKRPAGARNWKHGHADTPVYKIWQGMRGRCSNPKNKSFPDYGGRGIRVCARWDRSFAAFYADMGPRPSTDHSIDRKNNDGDYCKRNCRWATSLEQNNNSGNCRWLTKDGVTDTTVGWAKRLGCHVNVLRSRLFDGWDVDDVLSGPFVRQRPKRATQRYDFDGQSLTIPQWAERVGIPRNVINYRLSAGWTLKDALTTPQRPHVRKST